MRLPVAISIPYLWGDEVFRKDDWAPISYLVGANGTGKSLFAMQLKDQCSRQGLKPRYLNAERLVGLERQTYSLFGYNQMERGLDISQFLSYKANAAGYGLAADAFVLLKERIDIRIRIEATLSQLFARRMRLAEVGGFLKPMVQRVGAGEEYGLREGESHGLKELITLLTFIYSDEHDCLILDEPELHLHPQFQALLLQEMRLKLREIRTKVRARSVSSSSPTRRTLWMCAPLPISRIASSFILRACLLIYRVARTKMFGASTGCSLD